MSIIEAKTTGQKAEMIAKMKEGDRFMISWGYHSLHISKDEMNIKVDELKNLKVSKMKDTGTVWLEIIKK